MVDLYTKAVLTVIAAALCCLAIRGPALFGPAIAQGSACGAYLDPCHVKGTVKIDTGIFGLPV